MPSPDPRRASLTRETAETRVALTLALDGTGTATIATGVGFLDHMLNLLARHAQIDLHVEAAGDLHVDAHHTVEDVGIALGQALAEAVGDKRGLTRYGVAHVPMDESLTRVAVDLSGRPFLAFDCPFPAERIGAFDTELVREFFGAVASNARLTLHAKRLEGLNAHHLAESLFKGLGRALREALSLDPREAGRVPSTKGSL